jgi:hypothetical protein
MEEEFDTHGSLMCVCESRTTCAYRLGTWLLLDDFVQFWLGSWRYTYSSTPLRLSITEVTLRLVLSKKETVKSPLFKDPKTASYAL